MTAKSKVALTKSMLDAPKKLAEVFDLQPFRENFVKNYSLTTGKSDGGLIWEREKVLFMKLIGGDKKLEECTRLSIYSSFIELAVSGLTLNDSQCYIIPYKGVATFQVGWRGRLEQIARLPYVQEIGQPTVVYESDDFDYALGGLTPQIIKHKRTTHEHSEDLANEHYDPITHVYLKYSSEGHEKSIIMERHEVLAIRDNFSESYKYYARMGGKYQNGSPIDPPMWVSHPEEAFKKTLVKRLYKQLPKTGRMQILDDTISDRPDLEEGTVDIDYGVYEEVTENEANQEQQQNDDDRHPFDVEDPDKSF